uniref:hypothetical protein n=1 Tax=Paenarthrobacter ureafaciens TaxID=37931 RepID=UPI003F495444
MDVDGTTRRFVSVDLTVPVDSVILGSKDHMIVPLGVLQKGPKQRLDASYEGKPVAVLGRQDHAELVAEMLEARLPDVLKKSWPRHSRRDLFHQIATCTPNTMKGTAEAYWDLRGDLLGSRILEDAASKQVEGFDTLVHQMLTNYVFLVEVKKELAGQRIVLKYALDQAEPNSRGSGQRRLVILQAIPDLGWAASHHMEVGVPSGLVVDSLTLAELGEAEDGTEDRFGESISDGRIGHVNLEPSSPRAVGILRAELLVAKQGVYFFSLWTVISLISLVALAFFVQVFDGFFLKMGPETIPSPAASILLVGPALLISWMSRLPEHRLVARMIGPLRGMLTISALALVSMAGLAAVRVQPGIWHAVWWLVAALALVVSVWFLYFSLNWRPSKRQSEFVVEYM